MKIYRYFEKLLEQYNYQRALKELERWLRENGFI